MMPFEDRFRKKALLLCGLVGDGPISEGSLAWRIAVELQTAFDEGYEKGLADWKAR